MGAASRRLERIREILLQRVLPGLLLANAIWLTGCRSPARTLSLKMVPAQKDTLLFQVELDSAVAPEEYRRLADEKVAVLSESDPDVDSPHHPVYRDAPLYEIRYSFHAGTTLLASVLYRLQDGTAGENAHFTHQHTFVHPGGLTGR